MSGAIDILREEAKQYIDHADERAVKMVIAMLEADTDENEDWFDTLPENVKQEVANSLKEFEKGETYTHEEVQRLYPRWAPR